MVAQDTNLFRTFKIGTCMCETLTNAFSQQDRTLLRLQKKKTSPLQAFKVLGQFLSYTFTLYIDHASFAEHQMMVYSNPNNKPIDRSHKQGGKDLFADHHSEFGVQHSVLGILQKWTFHNNFI